MSRPLSLALGGLVALATATGVGRFVYTPILPLVIEDLGMTESVAGLLASANFSGYLAGALLAATRAVSGSRRRRSDRALRRPFRGRRCRHGDRRDALLWADGAGPRLAVDWLASGVVSLLATGVVALLVPDARARRLTIRFHSLASPRATRALGELCALLNQHETVYPGTTLRLRFAAPALQE